MLTDTIKEKLTIAMRARDKENTLTLRSLLATLHNKKIELGKELTDEDVVKAFKTELKKRDEAFDAFIKAGREESAQNESREKKLILSFLPEQMSEEAIEKIVDTVIATKPDEKNFGLIMKEVMAKTQGKADGASVSAIIKKKMS